MGVGYAAGFHAELLTSVLSQAGLLFLFCGILIILSTRKSIYVHDHYVRFLFVWIVWEVLFFVFYPSNEIRYVFISLISASCLVAAITSSGVKNSTNQLYKRLVFVSFISISAIILAKNGTWSDYARGSFGANFVIADKKIKLLNENYHNILAIYGNFSPLYYARNTSNTYLNIHPKHEDTFSHIYKWNEGKISILNPEMYSKIIVLDERAPIFNGPPLKVFNSVIEGSLWDRFHSHVGTRTKNVNLYTTSTGDILDYPQFSGIYAVKH
jgi:hypothetical protein